jgi:hypothetical protein
MVKVTDEMRTSTCLPWITKFSATPHTPSPPSNCRYTYISSSSTFLKPTTVAFNQAFNGSSPGHSTPCVTMNLVGYWCNFYAEMRTYHPRRTVLSEILATRVCGGSKFMKNEIIRKMLLSSQTPVDLSITAWCTVDADS